MSKVMGVFAMSVICVSSICAMCMLHFAWRVMDVRVRARKIYLTDSACVCVCAYITLTCSIMLCARTQVLAGIAHNEYFVCTAYVRYETLEGRTHTNTSYLRLIINKNVQLIDLFTKSIDCLWRNKRPQHLCRFTGIKSMNKNMRNNNVTCEYNFIKKYIVYIWTNITIFYAYMKCIQNSDYVWPFDLPLPRTITMLYATRTWYLVYLRITQFCANSNDWI